MLTLNWFFLERARPFIRSAKSNIQLSIMLNHFAHEFNKQLRIINRSGIHHTLQKVYRSFLQKTEKEKNTSARDRSGWLQMYTTQIKFNNQENIFFFFLKRNILFVSAWINLLWHDWKKKQIPHTQNSICRIDTGKRRKLETDGYFSTHTSCWKSNLKAIKHDILLRTQRNMYIHAAVKKPDPPPRVH